MPSPAPYHPAHRLTYAQCQLQVVPVIADSPRSATKYFALGEKNLFHYNDPVSLSERIDYWIEHPKEKDECSLAYQGFTRRFEQEHCMQEMETMILETIKKHSINQMTIQEQEK